MNQREWAIFLAGVGGGVALAAAAGFALRVLAPWVRSLLAGGQVSLFRVVGMRLRGNPAALLIDAHLSLLHGGVRVGIDEVESKYLTHRGRIGTSQDLVELLLDERRAGSAG